MLEDLKCECEAAGCERTLDSESLMLVMHTDDGERRAYECACGAVTITVARS